MLNIDNQARRPLMNNFMKDLSVVTSIKQNKTKVHTSTVMNNKETTNFDTE